MSDMQNSKNTTELKHSGKDSESFVLLNDQQWAYLQRRHRLTPRERQIAERVCKGRRNEDIAKDLGITSGTVKTHIRNIYRKTNLRNKISILLQFLTDVNGSHTSSDIVPPIPIVEIKTPSKTNPIKKDAQDKNNFQT